MPTSDFRRYDPKAHSGPRSYFTDIDQLDTSYDEAQVIRNLKLQLLTKEKIVVAGSAIFHERGYQLLLANPGLIHALEAGIILPAVREDITSSNMFFKRYQERDGYLNEAKRFFSSFTSTIVPWSYEQNAGWFQTQFFSDLQSPTSLLRRSLGINQEHALSILTDLKRLIADRSTNNFLQRRDVAIVAEKLPSNVRQTATGYADLVYRLSGSKAVSSDAHFPISNFRQIGRSSNNTPVSDEDIFWDMYVEAVVTCCNAGARITENDLQRLSFDQILKIREGLLTRDFIENYNAVIDTVRSDINVHSPSDIFYRVKTANRAAIRLANEFKLRVKEEIAIGDASKREKGLFQIATTLEKMAAPLFPLVGLFSLFKTIPEITALISPKASSTMFKRIDLFRSRANGLTTWSAKDKQALISGYREIVMHGISA